MEYSSHHYIYNPENGNCYGDYLSTNQQKVWKDGCGAILSPSDTHIKMYSARPLSDVITNDADLAKTMRLISHIYKKSNIIYIQRTARRFDPAEADDIANILGISKRSAYEYLARMVSAGILGKIAVTIADYKYHAYAFNPYYVNSQKYINVNIYYLFKPYLDTVFPEWVKQAYAEEFLD